MANNQYGDWELLDRCNVTGLEKWMNYDEDRDEVQISYKQDDAIVNGALDRNKAVQNESHDRREDMWHAAHVPTTIMYEWLTKYGVNAWDPQHIDGVKRLLNDPEYRYLRVRNFIL